MALSHRKLSTHAGKIPQANWRKKERAMGRNPVVIIKQTKNPFLLKYDPLDDEQFPGFTVQCAPFELSEIRLKGI